MRPIMGSCHHLRLYGSTLAVCVTPPQRRLYSQEAKISFPHYFLENTELLWTTRKICHHPFLTYLTFVFSGVHILLIGMEDILNQF